MATSRATTTPDPRAAPASSGAVRSARERLDARVREAVDFHFDPRSGTPFWIEHAKELEWDPRREVRAFEDLARLGPFREEWLRSGPIERWVPRALVGKPIYVFESSGGGAPTRSRISAKDFRLDYEAFSETLPDEHFPRGSDWIALGPTGPRRSRLAMEHLAHVRGGICFLLDMDPRWIAGCAKRGWTDELQAYKDHVIDQALTILRAHPGIRCMFTTPRLLEALCEKVSLRHLGITGVVCGGAPMDAKLHRRARDEMMSGACFVPVYLSTLFGVACAKPFVPEDEHVITYHAPQPRAVLEVVDASDPSRPVAHGERGRVKLTALTKELFIPGLLERDEATRAAPCSLYPWDGVADVRPTGPVDGL